MPTLLQGGFLGEGEGRLIVCLGWGSLIWDPQALPLIDRRPEAWRDDGPELRLEFARVSLNGRLTLVVDSESSLNRVLWNPLSVTTLPDAKEALRAREGTKGSWIGSWPNSDEFECSEIVDQWARPRGFKGVVWAAMPPKFDGEDGRRPLLAEALEYLARLEGNRRNLAEEYVRKAPQQIDTPYRRAIVESFGWTPTGEGRN